MHTYNHVQKWKLRLTVLPGKQNTRPSTPLARDTLTLIRCHTSSDSVSTTNTLALAPRWGAQSGVATSTHRTRPVTPERNTQGDSEIMTTRTSTCAGNPPPPPPMFATETHSIQGSPRYHGSVCPSKQPSYCSYGTVSVNSSVSMSDRRREGEIVKKGGCTRRFSKTARNIQHAAALWPESPSERRSGQGPRDFDHSPLRCVTAQVLPSSRHPLELPHLLFNAPDI